MTIRHRAFDPATGDWIDTPEPAAAGTAGTPTAVANDPEAPRHDGVATTWHILLAIDLSLLGLLFLASAYLSLFRPDLVRGGLTASSLAVGQAVTFLLIGVVPFLWVVYTRVGGLHGAMHYLKLERPGRSLLVGVGLGFALVIALALLVFGLSKAGYTPSNPRADELLQALSWPLVVFLAATAALGEEILFRGLLLRWTGPWVQAALFGLAHLDYGTPLQVAIPFALGLLWGFMVRRGARLWVTIGAHFAFDFIQFASGLLAKH